MGDFLFLIMLDIYIMTEQPVTCPKCGSRTDILSEEVDEKIIYQICECRNLHCSYSFIEEDCVSH